MIYSGSTSANIDVVTPPHQYCWDAYCEVEIVIGPPRQGETGEASNGAYHISLLRKYTIIPWS